MSGHPEPTPRSLLEAQVIPNEGLEDKCLDTKLSDLTADDVNAILDHVNVLYVPSPSIRLHILPFLSHLFLARPEHASLFPTCSFFSTLTTSLLLDPSTRILEQGLRLLNIVLPGSIVPFSVKLADLLAILGKAALSSQSIRGGKNDAFFVPQAGAEQRRRRSSSGVGGILLSPLRGMKDLPLGDEPGQDNGASGLGLGFGLGATGGNGNEGANGNQAKSDVMTARSMDTVSATSENEDKIMGLSLSPPTFMHHMNRSDPYKNVLQPASGSGWKVYHDPTTGMHGSDEAQEIFELYHHHHHQQQQHHSSRQHHQGHSKTQSAGNPPFVSATGPGISSGQAYASSILSEYLSLLYTAFPLNLVQFVGDPAGYLGDKAFGCPFSVGGWKDVWKQGEMARLISPYMKSFMFNPALLTGTAKTELEAVQNKFGKTDADELVGLAGSLLAIVPAQGLVETGPEHLEQRPQLPPRSMTEMTDLTSGSTSVTSGSPTNRSVQAVRHRRSSELALPVTGTNPLMAMSIAGRSGVNAYATAHPIAIRQTGGLGIGSSNEGETERLRKQVDVLTLELGHQKKLAGMYLQHVNRLYQSAVSARSGEAEQQNLASRRYNHIKDQERLTEQKNRELQSVKDELARTRKSSSEEKARLSAKMAENRELKKQVSQKQGARNDEILDRESLITHLKTELIKEKEKSFKLDNRLREAEPKIKKIGDYEKQIDRFEENQLLWDDDIKELQNHKNAIQTMTSAFVQMQHHTKAMQEEHDHLVDQVGSLKTKLSEISFENAQLRKKAGVTGEGETSTTMKPTFLLSEIETLRQKVESAQTRVHDLEQELLEANADQEELEFLRKVRAQGKSSMLA